jgi:sulfite reductase (NADPH) hemoprotein beta-component
MVVENAGEARLLEVLDDVLGRFARERRPEERFGDFVVRAGIVRAVETGRDFNR